MFVNETLQLVNFFEPLNLFFYTWRFLAQLEYEAKHTALKTIYRWFARVSILILPISFLIIVPYYIYYTSEMTYALNMGRKQEYDTYKNIALDWERRVFIVGPLTNLISCLILALVLFLVV